MEETKNKLMIYGANGYSAKLILNELLQIGMKPILAGRNSSINELAEEHSLESRIFNLRDFNIVRDNLDDIHTLLNCAGPFVYTAPTLIKTALETDTNYLDITGEIEIFEYARSRSEDAKRKNLVILPGVGFDIVPTDCLAKKLSEQMTDASDLKIGFKNEKGGMSRGTLLTTLGRTYDEGKIRVEGELIDSPLGVETIQFKRNGLIFNGVSIPWGDVYSAYYSTGIPNITAFIHFDKILFEQKDLFFSMKKLLSNRIVKNIAETAVKKFVSGPDEEERENGRVFIWGRVRNESGEIYEECYEVLEGYTLTGKSAAQSALRVLNEDVIHRGTVTPSLAFGSEFLDQFVIKRIF